MTNARPPKPHRTPIEAAAMARSHTGRTGLVLGVLAVLALAFAPFGVREAMFDLDYAAAVVAQTWARNLALLAVVLSIVALLLALGVPPRRGFIAPLLALAMAGGVLFAVSRLDRLVAANPPVHDVATDWADPLVFGPSFVAQRGQGANPAYRRPVVGVNRFDTLLEGRPLAEVNTRTCPEARPVRLAEPPAQAFARVRTALVADGLSVVTENQAAGRIEATGEIPRLKLKHDVLARVRPEGQGARVDFRSISRTGQSDLGDNCRRVARLVAALDPFRIRLSQPDPDKKGRL